MDDVQIQPAGFLLELSSDWLIQRASENVHKFLGEYHATLIGEPLAGLAMAQPLHDLRNSLASQRSSSGIARAYRVRLIDQPRYFDIAFQLVGSRILLEGVPSPDNGVGGSLGSVSRLIDGLGGDDRQSLLDGACRRMRALTGCDFVSLAIKGPGGEEKAESSRGKIAPRLAANSANGAPAIVTDAEADAVPLFPRKPDDRAPQHALFRAPSPTLVESLRAAGMRSMLNLPLMREGEAIGCFSCASRNAAEPTLELHAAAELLAQVFAMQLENSSP